MLLDVANIKKVYKTKGNETTALQNIDFAVNEGEYVAIMGESGSGKSTLLNIIATFDKATEGKVNLAGQDLATIKSKEIAQFRREKLGFVFQDFNVLDTFSNKDNILLPLVLSNVPVGEMEKRLEKIAQPLGITNLLDKFPYEISGGQRQRVAIARAIITQPNLLLADEPTGALDSKSSEQILNIFKQIHQSGNTILMVTHSIPAAASAGRVLFIKDGVVYHELYRGEATDQEMRERIAESLTMLTNRGV
ncbi:ABC transporter ATP-binding protein [Aerococcus urinaeequi]|jgi:putative bacteriocin export ABC transporter (lactococcin 972 group)|uniref:Bacteriocin ABC transporter ATP-binding protein n=1 Tax=Aerococcus urinaeequi TaxID=51665 RepID=A0AAC9A6G5_9LACT|nr:ABC transporter ATP-binding protein [Aerococcus urinaeequi]AMB96977.1 bacteriocin ABC transporter ATP-binding protein [Aerococcus urinaeequi]QGS37347.1 ATP-binding cassette domain-containing protein [Aerococcus viridans]